MFILLGLVTDGLYVLASGSLGALMASRERVAAASRWLTGGTYIALGITTAVSGRRRRLTQTRPDRGG
ncbi:MAG: hypothetical protein ACR2HR_02095 [Euzebya sp.]